LITAHTRRCWHLGSRKMTFEELIEHLGALAATIEKNQSGPIGVRVCGLDLRPLQ